jgi:DNA-binding beta-propeller fold protein YncE
MVIMRRFVLALLAVAVGCGTSNPSPTANGGRSATGALVFAAVQDDGTVAVVDDSTGTRLRTIDCAEGMAGTSMMYMVHNVYAAADGRFVWATAPAMSDASMTMPDELLQIDVSSLTIAKRIDLGPGLFPAHVVTDGDHGYVTAFDGDAVLDVDLAAGTIARTIPLLPNTKPHGLRLTHDKKTLIVAGNGIGVIAIVDVASGNPEYVNVPSSAVQTAVTPDDKTALATLYDARKIAKIDLATRALTVIDLPADSAGPVQIEVTVDGTHAWIADQGVLGQKPAGHRLYRMNLETGAIDLTAEVAAGPHGVAIDGDRVWTTLTVDGLVQSIDAETGAVITTTPVGRTPNGIAVVARASIASERNFRQQRPE